MSDAILKVTDLSKSFPTDGGRSRIHAVSGVSLSLARQEVLGIVGESGCGKSTLARLVLRLVEPSGGSIEFDGEDALAFSARELRRRRRDFQMIFQDPFASLDPRLTVGAAIAEPLVIHRIGTARERAERVAELLQRVGLGPEAAARYPHEFSGGQRQRVSIARAIAPGPRLIVADEPVSALDVSIQSQILNLLVELRAELSLSYLFISHDLAVIKHISDRVAVMYLGQIVELAAVDVFFEAPRHPYAEALISAIPEPKVGRKRERILLSGDVPNPEFPPSGCPFHPRCPKAMPQCSKVVPEALEIGTPDRPHMVRCHLYA
jgi:peptide/nickel transport system ATP-binding protein